MTPSVELALGLGLLLGLRHALEADHLVAVATIVSEQRTVWRASWIGAIWGVGHTVSLTVCGLFVIVLNAAVPEHVSALLELLVGLMIVALGSRMLALALRDRSDVHVHVHTHDGRTHSHLHFHDDGNRHSPALEGTLDHSPMHAAAFSAWRPLLVGMMHGLAGSGALTLLVLSEVTHGSSRLAGLAYMVVFGIGSIGGMLLMSAAISLPFIWTSARFERIAGPVRVAAGLASVAFGLYYTSRTAGTL